jgi:hypothetical protein
MRPPQVIDSQRPRDLMRKLTEVRMTIAEDNIRTKSISDEEPLLRDLFLFTAEIAALVCRRKRSKGR